MKPNKIIPMFKKKRNIDKKKIICQIILKAKFSSHKKINLQKKNMNKKKIINRKIKIKIKP